MANNRVISAVLSLEDRGFSSGLRRAGESTEDFERRLLSSNNQVNKFGKSVVKSFKTVVVAAGTLATTGITAFGTAVTATMVELDTAFSRLEARTGLTGEELKGLEDIAKNVFVNGFGESIAQVTDDISVMKAAFKDLNDTELQGITEGAMTIGAAFDAETKEVARALSTMTKTFDDLGETDALDLMTTAFQRTGDMSDELLDTFNEYSVQFKALGYDAEGFTATLIAGVESGAFNMDKLADSAKESFIKLGEGSKDTTAALKAMGLDATKVTSDIGQGGDKAQQAFMAVSAALATVEDPAKRSQLAIATFGTPLEDLGPEFATFFGSVNQDLGNFEGATKRAADAMNNNFSSRVTNAWRDIKVSAADAFTDAGGGELLDAIALKAEELVPKVEELVTSAIDFANEVHENWGTIVKVITPIGSAIGSVLVMVGAVAVWNSAVNAMNLYKASAFATTFAQHGFNAALKANPIGFVITVIALLVAAGVALYQNWDVVTTKTKEVWNAIGGISGTIAIVLGPIGFLVNAAIDLATNWDSTKSVWENVWGAIQRSAATSVNAVIGLINEMIGTINKIPGVNIPIVAKVDWGSAKAPTGQGKKTATTSTSTTTGLPSRGSGINGLQSYDVGTNRVTRDMPANIHKDEMIIPARQAQSLRKQGVTIDNIGRSGGGNNFVININGTNKSTSEIINELVPQLKLRMQNM